MNSLEVWNQWLWCCWHLALPAEPQYQDWALPSWLEIKPKTTWCSSILRPCIGKKNPFWKERKENWVIVTSAVKVAQGPAVPSVKRRHTKRTRAFPMNPQPGHSSDIKLTELTTSYSLHTLLLLHLKRTTSLRLAYDELNILCVYILFFLTL